MDPLSANSRPRTYNTPKSEEDLADWTSRIKALQRQVDADDEAEQRRLEEEIAVARKARLRRSRGAEDATAINNSPISNNEATNPPCSDSSYTSLERQNHQGEALRRLTNTTYNSQGANFGVEKKTSLQKSTQPTVSPNRTEPMSLAAFMGGRAPGPRLNKHAPQQDATDPTQFEQRTHITAIHPVFGRSGIAMPGLAGQRQSEIRAQDASDTDGPSQSNPPSLAARNQQGERSVSPHKTEDKENKGGRVPQKIVERQKFQRIVNDEKNASLQRINTRHQVVFPLAVGEKEKGVAHQKVGSRERAISTPVGPFAVKEVAHPPSRSSPRHDNSKGIPSKGSVNTSPATRLEEIARGTVRPSSSSSVSPQKPPSSAPPYLARPIRPQPRPLSQPPLIPPSHVPSPAFTKPQTAKELTPSISRLQGRGFVQSMVKISSQLGSPEVAPPNSPTPRGTRKSSVLDRWQPAVAASSSTSSLPAPKPITFPKAPSSKVLTSENPRSSSAEPVKHLRTRASLPSISQGVTGVGGAGLERNASLLKKMPPDGAPGLGSATTMAIYKPSISPLDTVFPNVDELGVRKQPMALHTRDAGKAQTYASSGLPPPSGKPLSHPTKDRAKKPRRLKDSASRERDEVINSDDQSLPDRPSAPQISTMEILQRHAHPLTQPSATAKLGDNDSSTLSTPTKPILTIVSPVQLPPVLQGETKGTARQESICDIAKASLPQSVSSIPNARKDKIPGGSPHVGVRHVRTPSTGARPTVMEVALALSQQANVEVDRTPRTQEQKLVSVSGPHVLSPETIAEKRKSTLEKYASIMLPALKEEPTPTSTPDGTLSRKTVPCNDTGRTILGDPSNTNIIQLEHEDDPLPAVDINQLLKLQENSDLSKPGIQTISVDVLNIMGLTATAVTQNSNTFYDTELLAIVYRYKSKLDGLVSTTLWVWRGKHCQVGDKEQRKIQELARRYGTNAVMIMQYSEPRQLVYLLGGVLAIRQGSRSRWSSENTTMHLVRENDGVIYIDEFDLSAKNLCSGFSYCLSILNTIYVWYGCGSTATERQVALQYAQSFVTDDQKPVELREGEDDTDEMFWMLLGGQEYGKADYWKWKKDGAGTNPMIWRIRAALSDEAVTPVFSLISESDPHGAVYVVDCIWEFFVLVGSHARGRRQDIRLGLDVAKAMSKTLSPHRPFPPTVHVLVLPSQLPQDLRLCFRELDEKTLNEGDVPDHMNILSSAEALDHLQKTTWDVADLKDKRMLPLGLDLGHVP